MRSPLIHETNPLFRLLHLSPLLLNIITFIGPAIATDVNREEAEKIEKILKYLRLLAGYAALKIKQDDQPGRSGYYDAIADIDNLLCLGTILSDNGSGALLLAETVFFQKKSYHLAVYPRDARYQSEKRVELNDTFYANRQIIYVNIFPGCFCIGMQEEKGKQYLVYEEENPHQRRYRIALSNFFLKVPSFAQPFQHWIAVPAKQFYWGSGRLEEICVAGFNYDLLFGSPRVTHKSLLNQLHQAAYGKDLEHLSPPSTKHYANQLSEIQSSNCILRFCYYAKMIWPIITGFALAIALIALGVLYKQITALQRNTFGKIEEYACANQTAMTQVQDIAHYCANVFFQSETGWNALENAENSTLKGYLSTSDIASTLILCGVLAGLSGLIASGVYACYCARMVWLEALLTPAQYIAQSLRQNTTLPPLFSIDAYESAATQNQPTVLTSGLWKKQPRAETVITMEDAAHRNGRHYENLYRSSTELRV